MLPGRAIHWEKILYTALIVWGIFYCSQLLTPSSYGIILQKIQSPEMPLLGQAKDIRSDEFTLITPLFQIAVHNHFERYNATSPYHEDLRAFIILPLKDTFLLFKPATWLFHVIAPDSAFSFYYYFYFVLFVLGYFYLFRHYGFRSSYAMIAAFTLYFCSFTQYWYCVVIGQLAWFPWLLLAWYCTCSWLRPLLLFYAFSALLFSSLYTPGILPFAYAGVWLSLAFSGQSLKIQPVITGFMPLLLALLLFGWYNQDSLLAVSHTIYPGQRVVAAGSLNPALLLEYIFPAIGVFAYGLFNEVNLFGHNICETGTSGSYLLLVILFFSRQPGDVLGMVRQDRVIGLLALGIAILLVWMLLPIPARITHLLLMDRIAPERWLFALGLLWYSLLLYLLVKRPCVVNRTRLLFFTGCIITASVLAKTYWLGTGEGLAAALLSWRNNLIIPLVILTFFICRKQMESHISVVLAISVMLANAMAFGFFNPWQSAKPIFSPPQTNYWQELKNNPDNFMNGTYYIGPTVGWGAAHNGLGLQSISHVQMIPMIPVFTRLLGHYLPPATINTIFNRYAHIVLYDDRDKGSSVELYQRNPFTRAGLSAYPFNDSESAWTIYCYTDIIFIPREFVRKHFIPAP